MNNIANLNVLIIQNYVIDYDFDNNCKEIIKLIDKSMLNNKKKNIIICLPEYCWTGYIEKKYEDYVEKYPKIIRKIVKELCVKYKCYIQPGTYIIKQNNKFYNYAELFDPTGKIICKYYKENLWMPYEKRLTSGVNMNKMESNVFTIGNVKIGLIICYDSSFPHMYQKMIKNGVEVVLVPTLDHYTRSTIRKTELEIIHPGLSFIYSVYIVCTEGRGLGGGESFVTNMDGDFISILTDKNLYKLVDLDIKKIKSKNKNPYIIRNQMLKNI